MIREVVARMGWREAYWGAEPQRPGLLLLYLTLEDMCVLDAVPLEEIPMALATGGRSAFQPGLLFLFQEAHGPYLAARLELGL